MDPRQKLLPIVWDFDESQLSHSYATNAANATLSETEPDTEDQPGFVPGRSPPPSSASHRTARSAYIRIDEDDASWNSAKSSGGGKVAAPMENTSSGRLRLTSSNSASGSALPTIMENSNKPPTPVVEPSSTSTGYESRIKRWDTETKMATAWHIAPRDPDLWYGAGNCLVYLSSKDAPVRHAAFRIPLANIHEKQFSDIFYQYESHLAAMRPQNHADLMTTSGLCELFVPAPEILADQDPSIWYITMRNFFAFLCDKPIVGASLSRTLLDLHRRMMRIRPNNSDNTRDFFRYLDAIGYLDFNFCPDYALAALQIAEQFEITDLWVDAFTHCVGMSNILVMSGEFENIPAATKLSIAKSSVEVDIFLDRVNKALSNFLEDVLSPSRLGLSQDARIHLDRFRSFLHTFYVEKFGYWPPPAKERFPKAIYKSMYFDFRDLYDLLSDDTSSDSFLDQKPATGGICVIQNINAFNKRHKFDPLPHSMPLLPILPSSKPEKSQSQRGIFAAVLNSQQSKGADSITMQASLFEALNKQNLGLFSSPLVRGYLHFEKQWSSRRDGKVSIPDGRKVRWLLIYGILQMLISVLRAPREVRDIEGPNYALCSPMAVSPPWVSTSEASMSAPQLRTDGAVGASFDDRLESVIEEEDEPKMEIAPDCEKTDFIARPRSSRSFRTRFNSVSSSIKRPSSSSSSPGRFGGGPLRNFNLLNKMRKPPPLPAPTRPKFCAIVVDGYGDGMDVDYENEDKEQPVEVDPFVLLSPSQSLPQARHVPRLIGGDQGLDEQEEDKASLAAPSASRPTAGPWPLSPSDIVNTREEHLRTPSMDAEEMQKMYQPYIHVSSSEYSISSTSSADNDITPRAKDIMRDVIIPGLKNGDCDSNPRDSCQTSSDSSQDSAPRPATPQDEDLMPPVPGFGFEHQMYVPTNSKPEVGGLDDDLEVEPMTPRPFHGIHIKRTFSVESFMVKSADEVVEPNHVQVRMPSSSNLRHQSSRDYLANKLDRASSVTSIRSNTPSSFSRPLRFLAPSPLPFQRSSSIGRVPEVARPGKWSLPKGLSRSNSTPNNTTVGLDLDQDGSRTPSRSESIVQVGSRLRRLHLS